MVTKFFQAVGLSFYVVFMIMFGFLFWSYHSVNIVRTWRQKAPDYPKPSSYMIFNCCLLSIGLLTMLYINIMAFYLIYFVCTL